MKKILLVNPPVSIYINKTAFLPLPLLVLGTCLNGVREQGWDFTHEIIDLDLMLKQGIFFDDESFYEQSSDLLLGKRPDILLFTVHGLNHIVILKLAKRIKDERPSCIIVVGGVGPTLQAAEALRRCANIDIIVKGEGETALEQLIPALLNNGDLDAVPSIVYRRDGQVLENQRLYLNRGASIPSPDYSLVRIEDYIIHNKTNPYIHPGFVPIESGRGCPHSCSFCAPAKMWERNVRYRPVSEIIEEMKFLAAKGGNFSFFTQDNLEEKFLRALSETLIEEQIDVVWGCYSRLDRLSADMADLLSKAGCKIIFTGFETSNPGAQKSIRKVVNWPATFKKLQVFNGRGVQLIGSFIAGFPDETDADLNGTMLFALECATGLKISALNQLISKTSPDKLPQKGVNICAVHPLSYMPGTEAFEQEKENLRISKYALHPDCYGSYLFGYEEYKNDFSHLGGNPYLTHLPEDRVRYNCSILRLFNFLNSRPYYFALLLSILRKSPLDLVKKMITYLGEEFVLSAKITAFEAKSREFIMKHLDFTPEWTVKKGQSSPT
jgi:radical SAM superfamily enzyme YgiQ (UPF0313 family)